LRTKQQTVNQCELKQSIWILFRFRFSMDLRKWLKWFFLLVVSRFCSIREMDFCEKKNEKIILRENILGSMKKNCGKKEKEREMKYGKKNKEKRN